MLISQPNMAIQVCPCKYPLMIVDRRDSSEIVYISFPVDIVVEGGFSNVPDIEAKEIKGTDGIFRQYMEVRYKDLDHNETEIKHYEIDGHIVYAGCEKEELQCDKKSIYSVLHPLDEWYEQHVVTIEDENKQI